MSISVRGLGFILITCVILTTGCRRVTVVSDSLLNTHKEIVFNEIDSTESWIYTEHIHNGTTSYTNPIRTVISSSGVSAAFSSPDATVMSFGSNETIAIYNNEVSYEHAFNSFWELAHQAVEAGSQCIVLFQGSDRIYADSSTVQIGRHLILKQWFADMHQMVGTRTHQGVSYRFAIADISEVILTNPSIYLVDYVHLNSYGSAVAGNAISAALNTCPEGRWVYGENRLK